MDFTKLALPAFNEADEAFYDFDIGDFGMQPDYSKDYLIGKVVYIFGVSESTFEGDYAEPARSLLHRLIGEPGDAIYGCLLGENSLPIKNTKEMMSKGKVPFTARIVQVESKVKGHNPYWKLERYIPSFNADGTMIDPNDNSADNSAPKKDKNS